MCSSILTSIYIVGILGGGLMTVVALFTPGWASGAEFNIGTESGILYNCAIDNTNCPVFKDLTGYQQGAASCMIIAAIVCAAGTIWGCIACFLCCCKACLNHPLPVFPIIALILNIIAISLYAANTPELEVDTIGYSMWIAIVSVLVLAVDAVVGIFLCKCCSMCCI